MLDMTLRAKKDELLTPLVVRFFQSVHPHVVSSAAMVVGLTAAAAVVADQTWLGMGLWAVSRVLDGLDGLVARVYGKQSDLGAYLDIFMDFIVYLAVPLAFVATQPTPFHLWAALALLSSFVLNLLSWSILSAILEKRRATAPVQTATSAGRVTGVEMPSGLIEGAETILFYFLFFLLPGQIGWLFLIFALLVLLTAGQRVAWAARNLA